MAEEITKGDRIAWCIDAMGQPVSCDAGGSVGLGQQFGTVTRVTAEWLQARPDGVHPNNSVKIPTGYALKVSRGEPGEERQGDLCDDAPALRFKRLSNGDGLPLPAYQTDGAAGIDICAATALRVGPCERKLIPTGFAIEVPPGFEVQVRPRSGLALNHGLTILNSPGTIDCDYRGEVFALVLNTSIGAYRVERGERIAQLVPQRVEHLEVIEVDELSETDRGTAGYGSTGKV